MLYICSHLNFLNKTSQKCDLQYLKSILTFTILCSLWSRYYNFKRKITDVAIFKMAKLWSHYNIVCVWISINLGTLIANLIPFKSFIENVQNKYCIKWQFVILKIMLATKWPYEISFSRMCPPSILSMIILAIMLKEYYAGI